MITMMAPREQAYPVLDSITIPSLNQAPRQQDPGQGRVNFHEADRHRLPREQRGNDGTESDPDVQQEGHHEGKRQLVSDAAHAVNLVQDDQR